MREAGRGYRETVHYLQHKISAQQLLTAAGEKLKGAYQGIAGNDPSIRLLEDLRADIDRALTEARRMASMDDAAPLPAAGETAA